MDLSFGELWKSALSEVQLQVSKATFLTLFRRTQLLSLENDVATIAAPSNMIIDLLKRRFYDVINNALKKQTGKTIKIIFVSKTLVIEEKEESGPLFVQREGVQKLIVGHLPRVRPDYTFENMAVSSTNQLAFVCATSVAKKIGNSYNPLFVYGPVGVGKTHLMQAIANDVYQRSPSKKILYTTSEEFTNDVVDAIRTNATSQLKRKYRGLDLLIIDDVQFIAGKEKIQEELFHTFNILVDNGSQIVLSSDRPPQEISKVEKRLLSRFGGGLTVDIEPPDFELRCAICLIKAKRFGIDLPIDIAKIIAKDVSDTRQLEGALLKVITLSQHRGSELSVDFVQEIVSTSKRGQTETTLGPEEIINNVCSFYKIKPSQLKGPKKDAAFVRARQVAMYLLQKERRLTYKEIGLLLGGRDHTTIVYGVEKIERLLQNNKSFVETLGISSLAKTA